jgi:triosephosphate isomerase
MTITKLAAGNWKMNGVSKQLVEAKTLAGAHQTSPVEILLCPPATLLATMAQMVLGSAVQLGGQDCHAAMQGAHTGDISAGMLFDAGAGFVILGHSERRADHHETSADVAAKVEAAWDMGLVAIVCVGETEAQRDAAETLAVIGAQLSESLPDGGNADNTVIAYEPVWAIGTGRRPSHDQIEEVHAFLRENAPDAGIRLLYGGSVNPGNAASIFAINNVDGALVGGASLKAEDFTKIVTALENS